MRGGFRALCLALATLAVMPAHADSVGVLVLPRGESSLAADVALQAITVRLNETDQIVLEQSAFDSHEVTPERVRECIKSPVTGCLRKLLSPLSIAQLVFIEVSHPNESALLLHGRLLDAFSGKILQSSEKLCAACTRPSQFSASATQVLDALFGVAAPPTALSITTVPSGAEVSIDGKTVGVSPLHYNVEPGQHVVSAMLRAHHKASKEVSAKANVEATVSLSLSPLASPRSFTASEATGPWSSRWKWGLLTAGASAVALGSVLVAMNEARVVDGMQRPEFRATKTPGLASIAVGAGLLATSGYLFWRDKSNATSAPRAAARVLPAVTPMRKGATLSAYGSF